MWMPGPIVSLINGMSDRLTVSRRFCGSATIGSAAPVNVVAGAGAVELGIPRAPSRWVYPWPSATWTAFFYSDMD